MPQIQPQISGLTINFWKQFKEKTFFFQIKNFSVKAHLTPPKRKKITRKMRRILKTASRLRPKKKKKMLKKKMRPWKKRRSNYRSKIKFRFPKWKFYYRRFWRSRFRGSPTGNWLAKDLYAYRLYRTPHQPYRKKNPRFTKKNKFYRFIERFKRSGTTLNKHGRLVSHQAHYKRISQFFGGLLPKQREERGKHLRRITTHGISKRFNVRWWFERRIDASLCRMQLAPSIKVARTRIRQGYVYVNNAQIIDPENRISFWDHVTVTPHSPALFLRYWYMRNRFQRYAFKNIRLRFNNRQQVVPSYTFGFWQRLFQDWDLPRYDRIQSHELHRLTLGFNGYYR